MLPSALGGPGRLWASGGKAEGPPGLPAVGIQIGLEALRKVFPEHFAEKKINQKFKSEKNSLNTLITMLP